MTAEMAKASREYGSAALLGTWAKIGKSKYQRCTGEIVEKTNQGWHVHGTKWVYQSRAAAFQATDYQNR